MQYFMQSRHAVAREGPDEMVNKSSEIAIYSPAATEGNHCVLSGTFDDCSLCTDLSKPLSVL